MQKISLVDFANFESLLTEEERMIMHAAKDFVNKEVLPIIDDCFEHDKFPAALVPKLGELGFLGANLEGYGCPGLNHVGYGLLNMMLEAGDSALRSFVSVQTSLAMYAIHAFGSEEQKNQWLPEAAKGSKILCFGLTEPDHGSNPSDMSTHALTTNDGYLLNGAKMWITNGSIADAAIVWAKLDGDAAENITGFIVEKGTKGFTAPLMTRKHSLRASVTSELIFQDCLIPLENILPKAKTLKAALACLNQARLGVAWGAIGAAMACYSEALAYSQSRVQFYGKPIACHQLIQADLVDMITRITQAQLLTLQVTRLKEQGKYKPEHVSMVKRNNVRMALDIARTARGILGANGISGEYPIMRHMANLESVITYEGTENIHTLAIGKSITGFSAF